MQMELACREKSSLAASEKLTVPEVIFPDSEDISKSWHDVEAHIMEINSCPDLSQTGPHLYDIILTQSVEGDGRIPSALIFSEKNLNLRNFISFCISNNKKVGIYTKNDIRINDMIIKKRAENSTNDFKILLMENSMI